MKLMILGATGLVGSHVLQIALRDPRITSVVAPVRKSLPENPKLQAPVVDMENLPQNADWWKVDAVICTLGTTIKKARTKQAFFRIDHDYPLIFAQKTLSEGAQVFVLNSAMGANKGSMFFYNQVKGQVEEDIGKLNFPSYVVVRPGLIGGDRNETRVAEEISKKLSNFLAPVLPASLKINPAENIAQRMVDEAIQKSAGRKIISASEFV